MNKPGIPNSARNRNNLQKVVRPRPPKAEEAEAPNRSDLEHQTKFLIHSMLQLDKDTQKLITKHPHNRPTIPVHPNGNRKLHEIKEIQSTINKQMDVMSNDIYKLKQKT